MRRALLNAADFRGLAPASVQRRWSLAVALAAALALGAGLVPASLAAPLKPVQASPSGAEPTAQPSPAATPSSGGRQRAVTMTRWVRVFHELEWDLIDALRQPGADSTQALSRLLAEDFEQRNARDPGVPEPREEWLAGQRFRGQAAASLSISGLAVHDHGSTAVVSFRLAGLPGGPQFIIDVWRKQPDDSFQLATRYAAPAAVAAPAAHAPAKRPAHPVPDGKG